LRIENTLPTRFIPLNHLVCGNIFLAFPEFSFLLLRIEANQRRAHQLSQQDIDQVSDLGHLILIGAPIEFAQQS